MTEEFEGYKFCNPFKPSLFHLALVKATFPYVRFYIHGLRLLTNSSPEQTLQYCEKVMYNRTKEYLSFMPGQLKMCVQEALVGMVNSVDMWQSDHWHIFNHEIDCSFYYWRSDGTIDRTKTAENLVINKQFDISNRFKMACWYSLEKCICSLWEEARETGQTEILERAEESLARFWFRWIPFTQEATVYKKINPVLLSITRSHAHFPRLSTAFSCSSLGNRQKLFEFLQFADLDDLRFCLYAMTRKEEEECMKRYIERVLKVYLLSWPLQCSFLEIADKFQNYMDVECFGSLLIQISLLMLRWNDLNYWKIFEEIWNKCPNHFKETVREWPYLGRKFDLCFDMIKQKKNGKEANPFKSSVTTNLKYRNPFKSL